MLLLIFYNVRSERELMDTLPERLDWLWFLDITIESPVPDHRVLSRARKRWGKEAFKHFFEIIVTQSIQAGLVTRHSARSVLSPHTLVSKQRHPISFLHFLGYPD
jgi:transposase